MARERIVHTIMIMQQIRKRLPRESREVETRTSFILGYVCRNEGAMRFERGRETAGARARGVSTP